MLIMSIMLGQRTQAMATEPRAHQQSLAHQPGLTEAKSPSARFLPISPVLPDLAYTPEVARETAHLYERVSRVIPPIEWPGFAPYIKAINELKRARNAVVLAHNYMTPEIFHCVADVVGDSLQLAREASKTDADIIVQGGVHFMAETSKLLNPDKLVLIPDMRAGCSLAASITGADVRSLRAAYPGAPVVTYVNTSAEVKAESDICCTSSHAVKVVESLGVPRVIFLPDEYLGSYVAEHTDVEVILWRGHCMVHERFTPDEIQRFRVAYDGDIQVLAHPECPPEVLAVADFVGSTSGMVKRVADQRPSRVLMVTECSMAANVSGDFPAGELVRPCQLCPYMGTITLPKIYESLRDMKYEITVPPEMATRARRAV